MGILSFVKGLVIRQEDPLPEVIQHNITYGQQEQEQIRAEMQLPELDAEGNDPTALVVYARLLQGPAGWAFEICRGGIAFIRQDTHPDKPGNVPMTQEEAKQISDALVAYHQLHPPEVA